MSSTPCRVISDGGIIRLLVGSDSGSVGVVTLRLYQCVSNAASLRQQVVGGGLSASLLRPKMVGGALCAISACRSAILSHGRHSMKTRSIATEIIYNFAPHSKISAALQLFGIQDGDSDVLAITVDFLSPELLGANAADLEKIEALDDSFTPNSVKLTEVIRGSLVNICLIEELRNKAALSKLYKLTKEELGLYDLERCCLSRMACKGI